MSNLCRNAGIFHYVVLMNEGLRIINVIVGYLRVLIYNNSVQFVERFMNE